MQTIELNIGNRDLAFSVEFIEDCDAGAPWENSDGHGPVTDWERRDKLPGEMVLHSDGHGSRLFYDFAEACRIALRDGWDAAPYNDGSETPRQQAVKAARADFEYLSAWCRDEWQYVGVVVTLLDDEGESTEVSDSLWCVETFGDYHHEVARQLADELASGYGTRWDECEKQTFAYM